MHCKNLVKSGGVGPFEILKYSIFVVLLSKIETLYMPYHSKVKRGNRWTVDTYPS